MCARPRARALCALLLLLGLTQSAHAQSVIQDYYVPLPESQIRQSFVILAPSSSATLETVISMVVAVAGTHVVYDQWEDGYELDLNNPTQSTTQVWGDGNNANGIAPGFGSDPASLPAGTVLLLDNLVPLPRNAANILYDGRDRVGATRGIVMSRAAWPTTPGPLLADALAVASTIDWGTSFISPVGEDIVYPTPATESFFEHCDLFVMAEFNGTAVSIDADGNGTTDYSITLNQGESYVVAGGVKKGATVNASKPVQSEVMAGDINANYESRWFTLAPVDQWSSQYYAPVGTANNGEDAYVFLYNPDAIATITIDAVTQVGTTSFTIGPKASARYLMPRNSAAEFTSQGEEPFFGVGIVGAAPTSNNVHDWGYDLVPTNNLTTQAVVGYGKGSLDGSQNGNPVWVTAVAPTRIYVDYNGDHAGPLTDPLGGKYDLALDVTALQVSRVYEPDKDQTGERLYTLDGTLITAAYGQDPAVAGPALPYLDLGTTIPNFPVPTVIKTSEILVDNGAPGLSVGDRLRYNITINNHGLVAIGNTLVTDSPPPALSYIPGTTTRDGNPIADQGTTPFPLDESGIIIPILPRKTSTTISYEADIVASGNITNTATASGAGTSTDVNPVPPGAVNQCVIHFTSSDGSTTVTASNPGDSLYVTITDADGNTNSGSQQVLGIVVQNNTNGDYESLNLTETTNSSGVFRNTSGLPTSASAGLTPNDGTLNVSIGDSLSVVYVDPLFGDTCNTADVIAAPSKTKILYLSTDGSGSPDQDLDRIDPVASGDATTAQTGTLDQGVTTITVDNTSSSTVASALSLTFAHTVNAGSNRLLLVGVNLGAESATGSAAVVSTVTYGTKPLTLLGAQTSADAGAGGDVRTEIWMLKETDIAAASNTNVVVTITGATNKTITAGATSFFNVDQTTTHGTFVSNTADNATSGSVTATSASGELVFGTLAWDQAPTVTSGGGETELWHNNSNGLVTGIGGTLPGAASVTFSYNSDASQDYAAAAIPIKPASGGGSSTTTFTMTPTLCENLVLPVGAAISAQTYFSVTSGSMPASPAITATLKYGSTTIAASSSTASNGTKLTFTFPALGSTVTVPSGQALALVINVAQSGVSFKINFDSTTAPSFVSLQTSTVIHVDSVAAYDAAYPAGSVTTTPNNGATLYVRTVIGDPFGSYDVTSVPLSIDGPGATDDISTTLTNPANVVNDTGCARTFQYQWNTGATEGNYTITATGKEGLENTVTDQQSSALTLSALDLGTPCNQDFTSGSNGSTTSVYATNTQVCVRVTDLDQNTDSLTAENVSVALTATSGDNETLSLGETGVNTGIFVGCIPASATVVGTSGNGTLYAPAGTAITATYTDPTDATDVCTDNAAVPAASPAVNIVKTLLSPSDGQIIVGEQAQFRLRVTNTGSTTLATVAVTDTFPVSLSYATASPAPNTVGAGTLTWNNVGPLTQGQSVDLLVTFTGAASANPAVNSATANAGGGVTSTDTENVIVTHPALTVTKTLVSPNPGPANIGDNVVFSITVDNVGDTNITNLPLEDTFSGGCFSYVSATPTPDGVGFGSLVWNDLTGAGMLTPAGAPLTISVTLKAAGSCNPATNTGDASFATDANNDPVPPATSVASLTTLAASISGFVYEDEGAPGFGGDVALAGITVKLYTDPNGDGNPADGTLVGVTTSLSNGSYQFPNLPLGNYVVQEIDDIGYISIDDTQGLDTDNRIAVPVTAYIDYPNNNFLDDFVDPSQYGSLSGQVRYDTDADGNLSDADAGIGGVTIDLYTDPNGDGDPTDGVLYLTTTTASSGSVGSYSFASVPPYSYVVVETDPAGFYSTGDKNGSNDNHVSATVPVSGTSTNNDFLDTDVAAADVSVTKSDPGTTQAAGGTFSYTVTVGNAGPLSASNVTVVDTLDSNTSFVSSTGGCVEGPVGTLTCNLGSIAASGTRVFTITVQVSNSAPTAGTLENGACNGSEDLCNNVTVSATELDPFPANNSDDEPTNVIPGASGSMSIKKSDDPDVVRPGGTLTYTLTYSNPTSVPLDNVTITESYDSRTTFVSADPPPDLGNDEWIIGTLDPGDVQTITITTTVSNAVVDGDTLLNTAVMTADSNADTTVVEPTVVAAPAAGHAELQVDKAANPDSIPAGGILTYTVTVRNSGSATAYAAELSDVLPTGLTYRNAVPAPTQQSGQSVQWDVGNLPPGGAATFQIYTEVGASVAAGTLFKNTAVAVGQPGPGTSSSAGLTAEGTATSSTSGPGTDCTLVVKKRHVGLVLIGNQLVYRCLWCDPCVDAHGVSVVDQVPAGLQILGVSSRDDFTIDHTSNTVTFNIPTLTAGRAGQAYITVQIPDNVDPGTLIENNVDYTDAALRQKSATDVAVVGDGTTAQSSKTAASMSVSGTKRANAGGTINATLRYRNVGTGSTVTAVASDGIEIQRVTPTPSTRDNNVLTWSNVGPSGTIKIRGQAHVTGGALARGGVTSIDASLADSATGQVLASGLDTAVVQPSSGGPGGPGGPPHSTHALSATLTGAHFVSAGLTTQLMLRYRNLTDGGDAIITLPEGLHFESAIPSATTVDGNALTWKGLSAVSGSIKIRATVDAGLASGTHLAVGTTLLTDAGGTVADELQMSVR